MTTYEALLRYLRAKAPGRIGLATLPFEGKNQVVYLLPTELMEEEGREQRVRASAGLSLERSHGSPGVPTHGTPSLGTPTTTETAGLDSTGDRSSAVGACLPCDEVTGEA